MTPQKHILHVAVENDALPGGKLGGIGDVIRDIAPALADKSCRVTVVMPSHGYLHRLPGARHKDQVGFFFRGGYQVADLYEIISDPGRSDVRQVIVHHPFLEAYDPRNHRHRIYVDDGGGQPFYTDANRFACFGAIVATAAAQGEWGQLDAIHLHDWHAAFVALLRRYDPYCQSLRSVRTVFTIHNLALQGIRPLRGSPSSLEAWFPGLAYEWIDVSDPRWSECCNMMACGIRLADRVHVVSPTYAEEICRPDRKPHAYGAEGLESVTAYVNDSRRLTGILNGCDYPEGRVPPRLPFDELMQALKQEVLRWSGASASMPTAHYLAVQRMTDLQLRPDRPSTLLTTISRAVDQKMMLFKSNGDGPVTALQAIMQRLDADTCYLILATGDESYHRFLRTVSAEFSNLVFLNGYSSRCAELLYANGDLFLMPSSFEPCGIGQMLAMRDGQPCLAHAVGGLKDTIDHGRNGFLFQGGTLDAQVEDFIAQVDRALTIKHRQPHDWQRICESAARARFLWADTVERYMADLYGFSDAGH